MIHPDEHDRHISIFEDGFETALKGNSVEDCPHEDPTDQHWWVEGWDEGRSVYAEMNDAGFPVDVEMNDA